MSTPAPRPDPGSPGGSRVAIGLVVWLAVCFLAAALGGAVTGPQIDGWYDQLRKPDWTPPDWVFGPVWTVLYAMMGVAAWLVWKRGGFAAARTALALFLVQLALNVVWSFLFFGLESPALGLVDIGALWIAIAASSWSFAAHSRAATALLLPYLLWVSYAAALNVSIWRANA